MIQHTAILIGSANFNEEVAKFNLNTTSGNYLMATDPRMEGYYYIISLEEDGYICFSNIVEAADLAKYEAGTLTIIN